MSVKKESKLIKVNGRLITSALIDKNNTFLALCELINNSIQASAKIIELNMESNSPNELIKDSISFLSIRDDGVGVSFSDFPKKILEIATDIKPKGKGTGRFSVFQFGKTVYFETISYDKTLEKYTKTYCTLKLDELQLGYIDKEVEIFHDIFDSKEDTYFLIEIKDMITEEDINYNKRKHKINNALKIENIGLSLFTTYPVEMLDKNISFFVNEKKVNAEDYQLSRKQFNSEYNNYSIQYDIIEHKSKNNKENKTICIRTENNGVKNILNYFEIEIDIPYKGKAKISWHIYVDSQYIDDNLDIFENMDFNDIDINIKNFLDKVRIDIENFFLEQYQEYFDFKSKLIKDDNYPYKNEESSSKSKEYAFIQIAYSIEQKYKLLSNKNKDLIKIIYPLLNGCIENPNFMKIINNISILPKDLIERFNDLVDKTELDKIIPFADDVASKMCFLDFLEKINYADDISKYILERQELHKIVEKELWIFGEEYSHNTILKSDKNLGNNLIDLRNNIIKNTNEADEITIKNEIKKITDLFFWVDFKYTNRHEVLIVELKRPSLHIGYKEVEQIQDYANLINESNKISKTDVKFKLILIGSSINNKLKNTIKLKEPTFTFNDNNIEIWIMQWIDLIKINRDKLTYMGNELKVIDDYIFNNLDTKYPNLDFKNIKSKLTIINNKN
ncbi:ATP-binding protein [Brachyspira alvinipulli]|uniref:ATP-binding protein n=1 Tax=Brachyspira alvinipulli TaxID=84379 RepID=UPI000488987C|nr:ATP-binding protein [Brachyspira alvinipulli]